MTRQHLVLDHEATAAWQKLKETPAFARTTASGVVLELIRSYLNPQTQSPHAAPSPAAPKIATIRPFSAADYNEIVGGGTVHAEPKTRTAAEDEVLDAEIRAILG